MSLELKGMTSKAAELVQLKQDVLAAEEEGAVARVRVGAVPLALSTLEAFDLLDEGHGHLKVILELGLELGRDPACRGAWLAGPVLVRISG